MRKMNPFQYTGNLYKKFLEIYVNKLKYNISKSLEKNDLDKTKELIKKIEGVRKIQKEIDSILKDYFNQFPEEKPSVENIPISNFDKRFVHYTFEILAVIKESESIEIIKLKLLVYNEIVTHISLKEISNNEKFPSLLNWELNFYKSVTFLLSKELIQFGTDSCFSITEKGRNYYGEDLEVTQHAKEESDILNDLDIEHNLCDDLIEKDKDEDMIVSIRSYLLSSLISEGIIITDEDSNIYDLKFFVIQQLYNVDGQLIEDWEQIQEKNYYIINSYFNINEQVILVKEKHERYNVLECIDEEDLTIYYAFI